MTDKREELIEEAAKAILDEAGVLPSERYDEMWELARRDARAALAVFEQAQAQTEAHEKPFDTSPERVKNGGDSSHVTPTDDEREAAFKAVAVARECTDGGCQEDRRVANTLLAAGFRRTVQGEPANATEPDVALHSPDEMQHNVQGEPSDAQVDAAIRAFHEATLGAPDDGFLTSERLERMRDPWRAALRAAAATQEGEDR